MEYKLPRVHPFQRRGSWYGSIESMDETPTHDFKENDLVVVLYSKESNHLDGDGNCACLCLLKDGRFVTWETFWGPTGDGFSEDAYGGDATIFVHSTYEDAVLFGLSPENRPPSTVNKPIDRLAALEGLEKLAKWSMEYDESLDLSYDENEGWSALINCNDLFYWGCADCEKLKPEDLEEWVKLYNKLKRLEKKDKNIFYSTYTNDLYCCQKRKMRPQGACYPSLANKNIWKLFDKCGKEREIGLGNPQKPGEREIKQKTKEINE